MNFYIMIENDADSLQEGGNLNSFASEWVDIGYILYVTCKKNWIEREHVKQSKVAVSVIKNL